MSDGRVEFREVSKVFGDGTRAVDSSTWRSPTASSWCSSGRPAAARRPRCGWSRGSRRSPAATVRIGDRVVNDLSPKSRDIAMVFQSYALYPHLTVRDNVAFPLKMKRTPKDEIRRRVQEAARILDLEPLLGRKPRALSGGQRQRVAMGRAIVREPAVFLMDEPLSNLDAKLRVQMRADIKRIPGRARSDDDLRHPRPGRGDDDGAPGRRDAQRRAAAGRAAAGALRPPGQSLRRRLHRKPGDEHARGARSSVRTAALAAVLGDTRLALDDETLSRRPALQRLRGPRDRARDPAGGSRRRGARERRPSPAARRAGSRCARRSGRRCSCTSRSPRRRRSPRTSASSPRTSATTAPSASSPPDGVRRGHARRPVQPPDAGGGGRVRRRRRRPAGVAFLRSRDRKRHFRLKTFRAGG